MAQKRIMILVAAAAILVIIAALIATIPSAPQKIPTGFSFNGMTYNFTFVAITPSEQAQGLMNYTVTNSTFELFEFQSSGDYAFWMKNTYSPLDMIWVYGNKVVYIAHATPCSSYSKNQSNCIVYDPKTFATDVIEARSGFVNRTGMAVGDNISIT